MVRFLFLYNYCHLMTLIETIKHRILEQGDIPFVEFMHLALYSPGLGYYSSCQPKFGVHGDFITAPELTPLFGYTLANQCQQVLSTLENPIIFEFGAGSGRLCIDLMRQLEALRSLPEAYHILEVSSHLRQTQEQNIQTEIPHLAARIKWHSQWPQQSFAGVVLANEVLDAMPVHRFIRNQDEVLESYISWSESEQLHERYKPCANARLSDYVRTVLPSVTSPYQSEANLFINDWLVECSRMLARGAFFIIDYGFPRHEYYHIERRTGTLMCHYHHQAHTNPLAHPGEEDITAHVDFTHVAEAGVAAGFHIAGYTNQAAFLLANGLLSFIEGIDNEREKVKAQQAAKQLLQAHEMGELFKVIALTKDLDIPLLGFQWQDKRASL